MSSRHNRWRAPLIAIGGILLFLCLPLRVVLHAAVAHVQTIKTQQSGAATSLTSASFTTTATDLLITGVAHYDTTTVSSVQLDGATNFTQDASHISGGDASNHTYIYSLPNVSSGSHTVTVTWSGSTSFKSFYVTEVSGAATSSPLDGAGAAADGSSTACSSGSFAATGTDFWYGLSSAPNTNNWTAGSGWTIPTNGTNTVGASSATEYQANPGSSPQTVTFTIDNVPWVCIGVAYKALAAAHTPTLPFMGVLVLFPPLLYR